MAGLPWYAIWAEFPSHGKTLALAAALKDDNAGMYVIRLWSHCANQALDGRVPAAVVEGACAWKKKRGALLDALTTSGFIEPLDSGMCLVHGWDERNGSVIREWMRSNSKRKPRKNPAGFSRGTPQEPRRLDVDLDPDPITESNCATPDPIRAVGGCRGGNQ